MVTASLKAFIHSDLPRIKRPLKFYILEDTAVSEQSDSFIVLLLHTLQLVLWRTPTN